MMKKKILKGLGYIVVGILVVLILNAFVQLVILGKDYITLFGYTSFIVESGSMEGAINSNDLAIEKITKDVKIGDIVTYYDKGYYITHRVVEVRENTIITKADSSNKNDVEMKKESIVGKVVMVLPFMKVFEVISGMLLILAIIVIFHFDKIYDKYSKKKLESIDPEKYNDFTKKILNSIKNRNKDKKTKSLSKDWIVRLRLVSMINELIGDQKWYELKKLVDSYTINNYHEDDVFTKDTLVKLREEELSNYTVLLLNAITCQDIDAFDTVFSVYKEKLIKEYIFK